MPRLLEVGLACRDFKVSPSIYGYDIQDPRVTRSIRMALNIHDTAVSRQFSDNRVEWDKNNKEGKKLLRWAKDGVGDEGELEPTEVRITIPERPKGR